MYAKHFGTWFTEDHEGARPKHITTDRPPRTRTPEEIEAAHRRLVESAEQPTARDVHLIEQCVARGHRPFSIEVPDHYYPKHLTMRIKKCANCGASVNGNRTERIRWLDNCPQKGDPK